MNISNNKFLWENCNEHDEEPAGTKHIMHTMHCGICLLFKGSDEDKRGENFAKTYCVICVVAVVIDFRFSSSFCRRYCYGN